MTTSEGASDPRRKSDYVLVPGPESAQIMIDALRNEIIELRDSRERAIRWAVTLEGQLAAIAALAAQWENATDLGSGRPSIITQAFAAELRAALTGSTE